MLLWKKIKNQDLKILKISYKKFFQLKSEEKFQHAKWLLNKNQNTKYLYNPLDPKHDLFVGAPNYKTCPTQRYLLKSSLPY